jgi:hypothetical protein
MSMLMSTQKDPRGFQDRALALPEDALQALAILLKAQESASLLQVSLWEFAIGVTSLHRVGIDDTAIRLLIGLGLAECRIERIALRSRRRVLRPIRNLALPDTACLVVTKAGLAVGNQERHRFAQSRTPNGHVANQELGGDSLPQKPFWDKEGTLRWGGQVVKHLRRHATCQRPILNGFEDAGWLRRIENPLPRIRGTNPKEQLRQAIRHLNEHHESKVMCFWEDSACQGIRWKPL